MDITDNSTMIKRLYWRGDFLYNVQEDDPVFHALEVVSVAWRKKRNGEPFLVLVIGDKTRDVDAIAWGDVATKLGWIATPGAVLAIRGHFSSSAGYGGRVTIYDAELLEPGEYDPGHVFLSSPVPHFRLVKELEKLIDSIEDPFLGELLRRLLLDDGEFAARWRAMPAAKFYHHPYRHGLMEHSVGAAQCAGILASFLPGVDRGLAIAGELLHDMGKVEAYRVVGRKIDFSDAGRLEGEIPLGYYRLRRTIDKIEGFPRDLALKLRHILLSHHGKIEYGSPVTPRLREALLVHMMDNLGGTLGSFDRLERGLWEGQVWSRWDYVLRGSAYFGGASLESGLWGFRAGEGEIPGTDERDDPFKEEPVPPPEDDSQAGDQPLPPDDDDFFFDEVDAPHGDEPEVDAPHGEEPDVDIPPEPEPDPVSEPEPDPVSEPEPELEPEPGVDEGDVSGDTEVPGDVEPDGVVEPEPEPEPEPVQGPRWRGSVDLWYDPTAVPRRPPVDPTPRSDEPGGRTPAPRHRKPLDTSDLLDRYPLDRYLLALAKVLARWASESFPELPNELPELPKQELYGAASKVDVRTNVIFFHLVGEAQSVHFRVERDVYDRCGIELGHGVRVLVTAKATSNPQTNLLLQVENMELGGGPKQSPGEMLRQPVDDYVSSLVRILAARLGAEVLVDVRELEVSGTIGEVFDGAAPVTFELKGAGGCNVACDLREEAQVDVELAEGAAVYATVVPTVVDHELRLVVSKLVPDGSMKSRGRQKGSGDRTKWCLEVIAANPGIETKEIAVLGVRFKCSDQEWKWLNEPENGKELNKRVSLEQKALYQVLRRLEDKVESRRGGAKRNKKCWFVIDQQSE